MVDKLLLPPQSIGVIELLKTVLREKSGLMSIEEVAEEMIDGELSEAVLAKEASTMQTVQAHDEEGFLDIESDDEGEEIGKLVTASSGMTPVSRVDAIIVNWLVFNNVNIALFIDIEEAGSNT